MILRRLIILATLIAGLAVSASVVLVALVYAVHSLLTPYLGAAGATALMVALVAGVLGAASAALFALSRPKTVVVKAAPPSPLSQVVEVLADTVRERPVVVVLAAIGAGVLAVRNPAYLASALRAFTAAGRDGGIEPGLRLAKLQSRQGS